MEDEKKRKKNKKKKNKQQQQQAKTEDTASSAGETSSHEQIHVAEQSNLNRSVGTTVGQRDNGSNKIIEDKGDHNDTGTNGSVEAVFRNQDLLQEEARLREMVKQLLYEKDSYLQRQADLEIKLKQLQCENDSWHQKEVSLQQTISQLLQEKASLSFEERSWQEKVGHLEKEKTFLLEKENSSKEIIATLNNENTRLRVQVVELEGAKINLSQENRQLIDNISTLHLRIQHLEQNLPSELSSVEPQKELSEKEDLNAQIEACFALIEKLVTENAELVEKVNELYMQLGQQSVVADIASVITPDYATVNEEISTSANDIKLFESVPIEDETPVSDDVDSDYANVTRHSSETTVSGEIVQIPLSENEARDLESQAMTNDGDESIRFTDAPLIGAPFRLISFVTRYVSGADLVDKSSSDSLQ